MIVLAQQCGKINQRSSKYRQGLRVNQGIRQTLPTGGGGALEKILQAASANKEQQGVKEKQAASIEAETKAEEGEASRKHKSKMLASEKQNQGTREKNKQNKKANCQRTQEKKLHGANFSRFRKHREAFLKRGSFSLELSSFLSVTDMDDG